ncbi:MAG: hypothetical protein ABI650_07730, partial [Dokdonella sp.]
AGEGTINIAALYQDVLLKRTSLSDAAQALQSPDAKNLAYEMAVCVCDADDVQSEAERAFLTELRGALGLNSQQVQVHTQQAEAIAAVPLSAAPAGLSSTMSDAEIDKTILNSSILNGALELLPESLATMAIIPLQMKLVYRIGKSYGFELDRGHIKDFLATAGVGLTSQYLEQAGRKLLGGLLGSIGGGLLRGIGRQAVSSGMSFASTYALGHVAKRYYAGGRVLSTQLLRESFNAMLGEAKGLSSQYLPQMQERARTINVKEILSTVRNG